MRLVDLNPRWGSSGGEGITRDGQPVPERQGIGLHCDCPCGCGDGMFIPFKNPLDGGPCEWPDTASWQRVGDTFETLSLTPSIQRVRNTSMCKWHGFITNGEIITC